jgi:hypothetical protein
LQRAYWRVDDLHPTTSSERIGAGGAGARRQRYLTQNARHASALRLDDVRRQEAATARTADA